MNTSKAMRRALHRTLRGCTPALCLTLSDGRPCLEVRLRRDRSALTAIVFAVAAATLFVLCAMKKK